MNEEKEEIPNSIIDTFKCFAFDHLPTKDEFLSCLNKFDKPIEKKQSSPSVSTDNSLWNKDTGEDYYSTLAHIESSGGRNIKSSTSSAYGPFQFTETTWKRFTREMGKNYSLEDRADYGKSLEVARFFTEKNRRTLMNALNRPVTDMELYTAHFLGAGGASKFLKVSDDTPSSKAVNKSQFLANRSIFLTRSGRERTVGEVKEIFANKFWSFRNGKKRRI